MNRELLSRVLSLVRDLAPGQMCNLTVEEAGVLQAFVGIRSKDPTISDAERALHAKIRKILAVWNANQPVSAQQGDDNTHEKRTQLALRGAIDKILEERWHELTADDEHLVRATYEVVKGRHVSTQQPDRLLALLETIIGKLNNRLETQGVSAPGKTIFAESAEPASKPKRGPGQSLTAEEAFKGGNRASISSVEGIHVDLSVRTIEYDGNLSIKGDVPSDVLLIVHNGNVDVSGFVAGCVVADGDIRITGNTQGGIIVSRAGNIHVTRALVKSILVAKQGDVRCAHLEDPTCVFAWGTVHVDGMMMGGKVCAAHVKVAGRVLSGELHSCGDIRADAVESNRRTPSMICLRKKLTCADYGREMDEASFGFQRRVGQIEMEIDTLLRANEHTHRLIHHCYRTALLYLVGGVESADSLRRLQSLQSKSIHLHQIIAIAERVSQYYKMLIEDAVPPESEGTDEVRQESLASLRLIQREVEQLPDELGAPCRTYLMERCRQFRGLIEELNRKYVSRSQNGQAETLFLQALTNWQQAVESAEQEVERIIASLPIDPEWLAKIDANPDDVEAMLDETIAGIMAGRDEESIQRASSSLIRVLKEQAERYKRSIRASLLKFETAKLELKKLQALLADDAAVLFGESLGGDCRVDANYFDRGVVLTTTPHNTNGSSTKEGDVIVLADAIEGGATFKLRDRAIQRV